MLPPPTMMLVQTQINLQAAKEEVPCTCGAKAFVQQRLKQKQKQAAASEAPTIGQKRAANYIASKAATVDDPVPHRSLWRKLLGKGPKCVCHKRRGSSSNRDPLAESLGLIKLPADYVGCASVTVSGKRVPFSRGMQQRRRASWVPLDAIEENE